MPVDLRISLKKLEALVAVVAEGGVGRAAEHLVVAQPVVSGHIRSLEERLGARLFYREGRQLHLTEAGQAVHAWADDVLTRTRELERHLDGLSGGARGMVALGASMSVGSYRLPEVLTAFRAANPGVRVRLGISDTEHAIDDARAGALDFAVVVSEPLTELPGLDVDQVGSDEIVLVTAPGSPPVAERISLEDLAPLRFIEAPQGIMRRAFVDRQLRQLGVERRQVVLELGHAEAMKRAVAAEHGVAMLFRSSVRDELAAGELREVAVEGLEVVMPIYLVRRKGKVFSPVHLALIERIRLGLSA